MASIWLFVLLAVMAATTVPLCRVAAADYRDALSKSILFFEGQRSGKLPPSQRMTWRKDSGLDDGHDVGVDLVGGYYDAGDNVKFGFPMAFTTTVLAWSILEFGSDMGNGELQNALGAVRWATDYFLKATAEPNKVYVQVGNPNTDHNCWERPEDMDTSRNVYFVDTQNPGSEVAAETAAALAASSIIFKQSDPAYAQRLLDRSMAVFDFASRYQGSYNDSIGNAVCPFYCDFNGYKDELVWGAAWIYKASSKKWYWDYVEGNINSLPWSGSVGEFGWDNKHGGIAVLLYRVPKVDYICCNHPVEEMSHQGLQELLKANSDFSKRAGEFACTVLPESPTKAVTYSPGGLIFKVGVCNTQHATGLSFLLVVLASYLTQVNQNVQCNGGVSASPSRLVEVARSQVDYILGSNPLKMSYMVGYGSKFPQRIHHRASSLPSLDQHPGRIACKEGTPYYQSKNPNLNLLTGAIVGGPNEFDAFPDNRTKPSQSEPITYNNAQMVGVLAYFSAHG